MSPKISCRIVFVVGGKGGVGKSWLIGLVAQWIELLGVGFALFDCDDETSTTSRFFPEARFLAIRSAVEIDQIVQLAAEGKYSVLLVDLPARAGDEFKDWFGVVPWDEFANEGIRFTALGVVSGAKDSIEAILRWREFLDDHVDYLIALNRRDNLDIYLTSHSREQFRTAGIPEIEIPRLDERFAAALDRSNWTIAAALKCAEPHFLTQIMSRSRLHRYREDVFRQFEAIRHLFIP